MAKKTVKTSITKATKVALTIIIIGAFNTGINGLLGFDILKGFFGASSFIVKTLYLLVGLCGIYCLSLLKEPEKKTTKTKKASTSESTEDSTVKTKKVAVANKSTSAKPKTKATPKKKVAVTK